MIIIEIQQGAEGLPAVLYEVCDSKAIAESKYHTTLSYAAVSTVKIHSVLMVDADGTVLKRETYYHE